MSPKCSGTTKSGKGCKQTVETEGLYCKTHADQATQTPEEEKDPFEGLSLGELKAIQEESQQTLGAVTERINEIELGEKKAAFKVELDEAEKLLSTRALEYILQDICPAGSKECIPLFNDRQLKALRSNANVSKFKELANLDYDFAVVLAELHSTKSPIGIFMSMVPQNHFAKGLVANRTLSEQSKQKLLNLGK